MSWRVILVCRQAFSKNVETQFFGTRATKMAYNCGPVLSRDDLRLDAVRYSRNSTMYERVFVMIKNNRRWHLHTPRLEQGCYVRVYASTQTTTRSSNLVRAHAHALALCGCTGESIGVEGATAVTARNFYFLRKSIQLLNLALATDGVTLSGILVHEPA